LKTLQTIGFDGSERAMSAMSSIRQSPGPRRADRLEGQGRVGARSQFYPTQQANAGRNGGVPGPQLEPRGAIFIQRGVAR
jgi:hypothetical protein